MDERDARIRYSRWDGTQRLDALDAEELLGALSDELLAGADLEDALARLARQGLPGRLAGLDDLARRLADARRQHAGRHGLRGIFAELEQDLAEIKDLERRGLERRRAAVAPTPELGQTMARLAEERLARLEAMPADAAGAIGALKEYEFVEQEAATRFEALLRRLQEQVLGSYFGEMRESLASLTPERLERTRRMMRDLDRALRDREAGEDPDFEAFQREYPELAGRARDWDDLLAQLAAGMAAMRSLWQSLPGDLRGQLESLLGAAFEDPGLRAAMESLSETLGRLMPFEGEDHRLSGDGPLSLTEALGVMEDLNRLSALEQQVAAATDQDDLAGLDAAEVGRLAGAEAAQTLEELQQLTRMLEQAGLIAQHDRRYELTPRGIRKIGQRSLDEIFRTLKRDAFGGHRSDTRGRGGEPTDEVRRYEFGDPFLLDLPGTVRGAVLRGGPGTPVRLAPDDFSVYRTELLTRSATAILVDVSRSMLFRGCFLAAKKVTLALDALIRSRFPGDDLYIVGFSAIAQELQPADLPRLSWNEYQMGTNMQHAFATARRLLARSRGTNKQIILITDGEPTAHFEPGDTLPRFAYPPTRRTFDQTLREVGRCTREGITINTFMLARGHYLVEFVDRLSQLNSGRAFHVEPERLGEYVLVDYVAGRRRRVA